MEFPEPVISMSIEPKTSTDKTKLGEALQTLRREDPTFRSNFDEETGQTIIHGMGELHLDIIANKLTRDMKVDVVVGKPKVAYKETILPSMPRAQGKHVKQTGGYAASSAIAGFTSTPTPPSKATIRKTRSFSRTASRAARFRRNLFPPSNTAAVRPPRPASWAVTR